MKENKSHSGKKKTEEIQEELTRLNKFLSHNSNYSRREADKLIEEGRVKVNGKVVTNLATKVSSKDEVQIGKKNIKEDKNKIYTVIVYNKPKGEIVSKKDPQGRKTIYDSLEKKYKHFLSVGRLDYASEGLLLLSDNVEVVDALMHSDLERVYKIKVNGVISKSVEEAMQNGINNVEFPSPIITESDGSVTWLKDILSPYCNDNWEIINNELLESYGVIAVKTKAAPN